VRPPDGIPIIELAGIHCYVEIKSPQWMREDANGFEDLFGGSLVADQDAFVFEDDVQTSNTSQGTSYSQSTAVFSQPSEELLPDFDSQTSINSGNGFFIQEASISASCRGLNPNNDIILHLLHNSLNVLFHGASSLASDVTLDASTTEEYLCQLVPSVFDTEFLEVRLEINNIFST
jgi:hypothetical protein